MNKNNKNYEGKNIQDRFEKKIKKININKKKYDDVKKREYSRQTNFRNRRKKKNLSKTYPNMEINN